MIGLLIDAALVLGPSTIAWVAGRRSGRVTARRLAALPAALMCTCHHGYGTHDDGGACSGTAERLSRCRTRSEGSVEPLRRGDRSVRRR